MSTQNVFKSSLWGIHNVVQASFLGYPKNLMIEKLREFFSQDVYYHHVSDVWGFSKTPDLTNMDPAVGEMDDLSTRIYIGEQYRYNQPFYPAVLVRAGSFKYVPLSMSRNEYLVKYKAVKVFDGYGNEKTILTPNYYETAGAWEGEVNIDVLAGDIESRDELVELISLFIDGIAHHEFINAGVAVRPISIGSPSETDMDSNDKCYRQTISLPIRCEWRRQIPIDNILNLISVCVDFQSGSTVAPNIEINERIAVVGS